LPNSEATNRKPVFKTHIEDAIGVVSKYFILISVTITISSSVSNVHLKISPCSVCSRKKNIDWKKQVDVYSTEALVVAMFASKFTST
jgi:hypothetical protein